MEQADKIVAIAALVGSLMLVTGGNRFRGIAGGQKVRLAAVWIALFAALVVLAQVAGLHTRS